MTRRGAGQVLYLTGNRALAARVAEVWGSYRKQLIARLPGLTFLDERPVHKNELRFAAAWARGGSAAEHSERVQAHAEEAAGAGAGADALGLAEVRARVARRREEIRARRREMGLDEPDWMRARAAGGAAGAGAGGGGGGSGRDLRNSDRNGSH